MADNKYYRFRSNMIWINWRKLGALLKFADKMFMKQKMTKN